MVYSHCFDTLESTVGVTWSVLAGQWYYVGLSCVRPWLDPQPMQILQLCTLSNTQVISDESDTSTGVVSV